MQFRVLSESDIAGIHDTALMMLDSIGMQVSGDKPRRAFTAAGAGEKDGRVLIGRDLVANALAAVPADGFELVGRDTAHRVRLTPGEVHYRPAGGPPFILDFPSQTRRNATHTDAANIVRVVDALDGMEIANSAVSPPDIGVGIGNVLRFVNSIRNSTKPTDITASGPDEVAAVHEIATAVRGDGERLRTEPLVVVYVAPTSPMRVSESEALAVMECAERGIPFAPLSCPTLAATAPVTMAGALAQQWAEELALIVLAYAIHPGLPVVACSRANPVDMRGGNIIMGGAAAGLMTAAFAELAASFNLPCNGWGFSSSSHAPDLQAGAERVVNTLTAVLSGTSVISGAGTLGNALIATPEQLVIDNEIIRIVRQACHGVPVTPDTLAVEHVADGVHEGTFMVSPHTVEHLHSEELWMADLFTAQPYESWLAESTDLIDRASERVGHILSTHNVEPVDPAVDREIDAILAAADAL